MSNPTLTIPPSGDLHTHTIILLHDRGSHASEFASELFESQASDNRTLRDLYPNVRWVFPGSQIRSSERFNELMPQWFDMRSVEKPAEKQEKQIEGFTESVGEVVTVVRHEAGLIAPNRIILGGISQGCAVAIHTLLKSGIQLGGFVGLSSWLPLQEEIKSIIATEQEPNSRPAQIRNLLKVSGIQEAHIQDQNAASAFQTPIFLSHARDDAVVPIANGEEMASTLTDLGFDVTRKLHVDGGHWLNEPQGVDDIVEFLRDGVLVSLSADVPLGV